MRVEIREMGYPLQQLPGDLQKMILDTVEATSTVAYMEMLMNSPMKTGAYRSSIFKNVRGLDAVVGPTVPYWPYIEQGTRPHMIFPKSASVLRFVAGGQVVFARHAYHPGTRPNPVVQRSWDRALAAVPEIWQRIWAKVMGRGS